MRGDILLFFNGLFIGFQHTIFVPNNEGHCKDRKNKKQVILFANEKNEWKGQQVTGKVDNINMMFTYESDLVIQATDEEYLLLRVRI